MDSDDVFTSFLTPKSKLHVMIYCFSCYHLYEINSLHVNFQLNHHMVRSITMLTRWLNWSINYSFCEGMH